MRKKVEIDEIEDRICAVLSGNLVELTNTSSSHSNSHARNDVAVLAVLAKHACDLRSVLDEVSKESADWRENTRLLNRVINVLSWGDGL